MAVKKRVAKKKKRVNLREFLKSNYLPYLFVLTSIGMLFVLLRMKGVEQQYKFNEINKEIKRVTFKNKELRASIFLKY